LVAADENFATMPAVPKQRSTIQVDPASLEAFRKACEAMPQSPKMSRVATGLVRWFARQSEAVKTAVISGTDAGLEGPYASLLRRLANELDAKARRPDVGEIPSPKQQGRQAGSGTERRQPVGGHQK
jgi:hypothetical protein